MRFYSITNPSFVVDFKTALFQGLAPDGGLYMPVEIPHFEINELDSLSSISEVGFAVLRRWIDPQEIPDHALRGIVERAFTFPIPLNKLGEYSVLELFHGPTMAFKDIAAGVLAQFFEYFLKEEDKNLAIVVATSGDTGGAMAQAFSGLDRVKMVILYPEGKVSRLQEEQLTRVENNVISIAVEGDFDDCQKYAKMVIQDRDFKRNNFSSANSINIGRLIPQIVYYVWTCKQLNNKGLRFVIPSGNMGNATACIFSWKMGLPIGKVIVATNENDAVVKYCKTGNYTTQKTVQTLSNAMDIGSPNNFARILEIFHHNHDEFCKHVEAIKVSDKETVETIKNVYKKYGYLMDFHTAVGYRGAEKITGSNLHTVIVSTASSLKFSEEILRETKIQSDNSEIVKNLQKKDKKNISVENNYSSIKNILLEKLN
jgi:threonine synthase